MCRVSLNLQNRSFPPVRDDAGIEFSDIEFFLGHDPHPHFRLTTASSPQLIEAGIVLKGSWQGLRLAHFYTELRSQRRERQAGYRIEHYWAHWRVLESAALVFQMPSKEVADLNGAADDTLLTIWRAVSAKREPQSARSYPNLNVEEIRWQ